MKETDKYLNPIDMLKYLDETCVKNPDGSLSLGTYEVQMIKNSIEKYIPTYAGWSYIDVVEVGYGLGYDITRAIADSLIQDICRHDCEVTWEHIEMAIQDDLYKYGMSKYYTGIEGLDDE